MKKLCYAACILLAVAFVVAGCTKAADKGDKDDKGDKKDDKGTAAAGAVCTKCMAKAAEEMKCPDCGMAVKTDMSKLVEGKTVLFCGKTCMEKLDPKDEALKTKALAEAAKYKCTCPK